MLEQSPLADFWHWQRSFKARGLFAVPGVRVRRRPVPYPPAHGLCGGSTTTQRLLYCPRLTHACKGFITRRLPELLIIEWLRESAEGVRPKSPSWFARGRGHPSGLVKDSLPVW